MLIVTLSFDKVIGCRILHEQTVRNWVPRSWRTLCGLRFAVRSALLCNCKVKQHGCMMMFVYILPKMQQNLDAEKPFFYAFFLFSITITITIP